MRTLCTFLVVPATVLAIGLGLAGCGEPEEPAAESADAAALPETLFLSEAPSAEPRDVGPLVAEAEDGQEVVVRASIGGRREPFVSGRALMVVTDVNALTCQAAGDTGCSTPWDYCCVPREELQGKTASVQVSDEQGQPLSTSLQAAGLEPLTQVIVQGIVRRDADVDAVTIDASGIYVER